MPDETPKRADRPRERAYRGHSRQSSIATLAASVVIIAALYFGRTIFVPLALAILISFALGPVVAVVRRLHLGRTPSVLIVVFFAIVVVAGLAALIGMEVEHLAENLPQYQANIAGKVQSLQGSTTGTGSSPV